MLKKKLKPYSIFILFILICILFLNFFFLREIFFKKSSKSNFVQEIKNNEKKKKALVDKDKLLSSYYKKSYLDYYGKINYLDSIELAEIKNIGSYLKTYYKKEDTITIILEEEYQDGKIIRYSKFIYEDKNILEEIKNISSEMSISQGYSFLEKAYDENCILISKRLFNKEKKLILEWVYNSKEIIKHIQYFYDSTSKKRSKEKHYNNMQKLEYYIDIKYIENTIKNFMYTPNNKLIVEY